MRSVLLRAMAVPLLAIVGPLAAGCGSESSEPAEQTPTTEATAAETSPAAPTTEAPDLGECPEATAITVESTNGAYPEGLDWSTLFTKAERPLAGLGGDGRAVTVYIGTDERSLEDLTDRKTELAPDEAFFKLLFTNGEQDAESGEYFPSGNNRSPNNVGFSITVTGKVTMRNQSGDTTGEAKLIESDDQVCGTFELADNFTTASGTFVAALPE